MARGPTSLRPSFARAAVVLVAWGSILALGAQDLPPLRPLSDGEGELASFLEAEEAALGQLVGLADRVGLAAHRQPTLAMAFYAPTPPPVTDSPPASPGIGVTAPRIVVREEFYLDEEDRLLGAPEMAVDVYEYLLHSVILAWFHLDLMPELPATEGAPRSAEEPAAASVDPEYRRFVEARAEELMPDAPIKTREAQYVTGLASFGSHILSLYNEIARARERGDGSDGLCRLLKQEGGLFGLWRRDLQRASYVGYAVDDGPPLERADQLRFLEVVLGRDWTGDPDHDLAAEICTLGEAAPGR